jgi:hypothetical protein
LRKGRAHPEVVEALSGVTDARLESKRITYTGVVETHSGVLIRKKITLKSCGSESYL